jgi:histidinol-phosphate aminotransferase
MSKLRPPVRLEGLDLYEPGKPIEEVQRESGLRDGIKLASNENPLGPSPLALQAVKSMLANVRYPDGPARRLREALAARHDLAPAQVITGNGSTDLIDLLARAFLGPEDNAVISEGVFARFRQVVRARNGRERLVPMRERRHDLAAMARAADARTKLVYVANPNNPTGTWNGGAEVKELLGDLPANALLVLDEAYFEFADDPDYPDGLDFLRRASRSWCCAPSRRPTAWPACGWDGGRRRSRSWRPSTACASPST